MHFSFSSDLGRLVTSRSLNTAHNRGVASEWYPIEHADLGISTRRTERCRSEIFREDACPVQGKKDDTLPPQYGIWFSAL